MLIFKEIEALKKEIKKSKQSGKRIGFVPTMGNLHEGHLSLLRKCADENDVSIVSIYVNPTQFGPKEDLDKYPRTLEMDLELAKGAGADLVFLPDNSIMYRENFSTYVTEEKISKPMCGKRRPDHFRGVATVVAKLFNIVEPDTAYFGQKDAQQALLIKKMASDLNFNIKIEVLPTVREKNGLAMSSRNNYLTSDEREKASIIYKALLEAEKAFKNGEKNASKLKDLVKNIVSKEKMLKIDYIDIRSTEDLEPLEKIDRESLLAVSASIRDVHLIDNVVLSKVKSYE